MARKIPVENQKKLKGWHATHLGDWLEGLCNFHWEARRLTARTMQNIGWNVSGLIDYWNCANHSLAWPAEEWNCTIHSFSEQQLQPSQNASTWFWGPTGHYLLELRRASLEASVGKDLCNSWEEGIAFTLINTQCKLNKARSGPRQPKHADGRLKTCKGWMHVRS